MKSIGEHLRTAREEKGFSFDQVVHDTNISREYIHALEEDNFDFFPAEAYLIGFLRNYSEYLGLDPSKMVGIYKNFKISEEPVPMDLLLGKKKAVSEKKEKKAESSEGRGVPVWLIPVIVIVLALAGASALFLPSFLKRGEETGQVEENPVTSEERSSASPKEFFLTDDTLDIEVSDGDRIKVSTGTGELVFSVELSRTEHYVSYTDLQGNPGKMELVREGEQIVLINESVGVYFLVREVSSESAALIAQKVAVDETDAETGLNDNAEAPEAPVTEASAAAAPENIAEKIVIMTETYPKAYSIDAVFRGDALFRYETDGQGRVERFFQGGERLKIEVNRNALLWASNAGNVDLKISGKEISIGENGQVVVRSVKWVNNNETGKYELVIIPYN